jgi:hypothetical protein
MNRSLLRRQFQRLLELTVPAYLCRAFPKRKHNQKPRCAPATAETKPALQRTKNGKDEQGC